MSHQELLLLGLVVILSVVVKLMFIPLRKYGLAKTEPDKLHPKVSFTMNLMKDAFDYTQQVQMQCIRNFKIEHYDHWEINPEEATLIFYTNDVPMLKAKIQMIGTHFKEQGTWEWAINNEEIPINLVEQTEVIWNMLDKLEGEWHRQDVSSQVNKTFLDNATALGVYMLQGKGFYRALSSSKELYLVFTHMELY